MILVVIRYITQIVVYLKECHGDECHGDGFIDNVKAAHKPESIL